LILTDLIDRRELPIRLVFETEPIWLQDLPWNACRDSDLISRLYGMNKSINIVTGAGIIADRVISSGLSKILIIRGDDEDIDTIKDVDFIKKNLPAHIIPTIEIKPLDNHLTRVLLDNDWDAIFYLGHTDDKGSDGYIHINKNQKISIDDFSKAFVKSVERGLQLLVFNSCSGMGLARKLNETLRGEGKKLPHIVVMRRPIGDSIAHDFIERFTKHLFVDNYSIERAITQTREFLRSLQHEFPGADSLPVLWCDSKAFPLTVDPGTPPPPPPEQTILEILNKGWKCTQSIIIKSLWETRLMKLPPIAYIGIGLAAIAVWPYLQSEPTIVGTGSTGEVALFKENKSPGNDAFKQRDYTLSIQLFNEQLRSHPNDRDIETRIYLSNAQALEGEVDPSRLPIIPVIVNQNITTMQILSGAGIAQIELNSKSGIKGKKFLIKIYHDGNNSEAAKQVAKRIVAERETSNIKALVGHTGSDISKDVADTYNQNQIVMIAPTSSDNTLTSSNRSHVFRPMPNSTQMAQHLGSQKSVKINKKIGFCEIGKRGVSDSFKNAFSEALFESGGKIVPGDCYSSNTNFNPQLAVQEMKRRGATAVLIYSHLETEESLLLARKIALVAAQNKLALFANHSFISPDIINDDGRAFEGMTVVTPRIATSQWNTKPANDFTRIFIQTLGDKKRPTWRSITSYDAVKSIVVGLNLTNGGTSTELAQKLHDKDFLIKDGADGPIRYSIIGDRFVKPSIATLQCTQACDFELGPD
jgi:ABC-type branched-subunit amino acid transport system substrate-binding protein